MDFESKSAVDVSSGSEELDSFNYAQPVPKYMGKKLKMKFDVRDSNHLHYKWYKWPNSSL